MVRRLLKSSILSQCGPQVISGSQDRYDEIFSSYIEFLKEHFSPLNIVVLNHALVRGVTRTAMERSSFQSIVECVPFVSSLDATDEDILAQFHASHRNDTRKAIKESFCYVPELSAAQYHQLSEETYARSGLKGHSVAYINDIQRYLVSNGKAFLSGVLVEDKLVAASIVIHHGDNSYYLHGSSSSKKPRGATTFLHYRNMVRLRDLGVKRYDMGGARVDENTDLKTVTLTQFKSRFGGVPARAFGGSLRSSEISSERQSNQLE